MVNIYDFNFIKEKYGHHASWAVWKEEGERPKDNVGNLEIFEVANNKQILNVLKPHIVFVGLNISRKIEYPLGNFHDSKSQSMDFKIRYALKDSPYWGGYMTDIIKDFEQKASGKMMQYLRINKSFEKDNIQKFLEELSDLKVKNSVIIAFGNDAYSILNRSLKNEFIIKKIPHYGSYESKEIYRRKVQSILNF